MNLVINWQGFHEISLKPAHLMFCLLLVTRSRNDWTVYSHMLWVASGSLRGSKIEGKLFIESFIRFIRFIEDICMAKRRVIVPGVSCAESGNWDEKFPKYFMYPFQIL